MRNLSIVLGIVVLAFSMNAQSIMLQTGSRGVTKSNDAFTGFQVAFSYDRIESVTITGTERGTFSMITIEGALPAGEFGTPQLPIFRKMIQIPADATPKVVVKSFTTSEYSLEEFGIHKIYPRQPSVRKDQDLSDVPFVYDEKAYNIDDFNQSALAEINVLGTMREVIIGVVDVYPVRYNPVAHTIVVYNNIEVEVVFENANRQKTEELLAGAYSPYFKDIYKVLFNDGITRDLFDDRPDLYKTPVRMLVIANRMFETTLQPWIEWKTKKGFYMDVNYTDVIGTTAAAIKTFCHNKYNQGIGNGTAPTFIIIVGDTPQVPASQTGASTSKATDLYYAKVKTDGTYFPDMYYSRMSAQTTQQLANIIEKTLYYEQYQFADPTYLDNVLLIAGEDPSWNPTVAQPTINYATTHYYNAAHGYATINKYLNSYSGMYAKLNNVGFANYTAHCSETTWQTSDPAAGGYLTISMVNNLTNVNKYYVAMGNCCLAADFGTSECIGEAMIRAQKKGAVGYIGSSPSSYWNDDLHFAVGAYLGPWNPANPTLNNTKDGCYDLMFRDADFNTLCSHVFGGNLSVTYAMTTSGYTINQTPRYYWEAYNVLGDGSIMPYNGQAADNTVTHNSVIHIGVPTYEVQAVPGSYVAISKDGVLRGVAVANTSGVATVTLDSPINSGGNVDLVVTRNQYKPYITQIQAVAQSGPYIVSAGYTVPVEEKLTYTSTNTEIAVTLKNVGIEASDNLNVTLSSNDPQLTIDKNTATCGSIAPDGSAIVKFNVTVANNIPDNKIFMTEITATETGKGSWSNSLPLMAYAPVFSLEKVLVNGVENGNLEAGTVVELTAVVKNKGGADAYKVKGNLDIKSPYITFACEEQVAIEKNLPAGETIEITFHVTTSPEMPYGHQAAIDLLLTAQYGRSHTAPFTISNTGSNNYCTPGTTNCSQYNDRITSLQLIKVSDQSVLINHAPTCSSGGYTNYTGMVANFVPGAQYTIKVKTGYQNHRVRGWIDLNGNKTFDSNEALFTITCTSANVEYSATFTIPEDFTPGTQRFRIRTQDGGTVPGPCNAYTYGQTLDYSAFLPELYPCVQNVVAVLGENKVTVTWNAPASGTPIGYNVYRGGNKLNTALLTTTTFTEQNITEGVYAYNVTAVYSGNKESPALMSNVVCNFTACIAPVELSVELEGNTAVLTWEDASEMAGILSGYNVFRNKTKINAALVTEKKYLDENLPSGTHNYQVTAVYEHCESEMTDAETITILPCETPTNVEAVVDNNTVIITWNEPEDLEGVELLGYNIYRNEEQINETLITELEYRDEELPAGTYLYQVTAVYEHCPESEMTDAVSVTILPPLPCETPLEPEGEAEGNTAIIIWGVKELIEGMELVKHHVYRDGIRLDGIPFMGDFGWEYHDEGLENGEYLYQTAAVYEHCEESEWTEGVVVVINVLTIADIPTNSYKIFPNPTHNKVNIVGNIAPNSVRIYNITGQLTYETTTCAANMTITIETMPTGIYFIKIDSDYGSTTQKLILK